MKFLVVVLCLVVAGASAQTKRIAHRSHSGSDHDFSLWSASDNFGDGKPKMEYPKFSLLNKTDSISFPDPPRVKHTSLKTCFVKAGAVVAEKMIKYNTP